MLFRKRILVHMCCGPCSIYPFRRLQEENFEITGFFYNPNIHPEEEYNRRLEAARQFADKLKIVLKVQSPYSPGDFSEKIGEENSKPGRCLLCWDLRLNEAARFASQGGFDTFTSTLFVSPYQDHKMLKLIGEQIARANKIELYYEDFRLGYRDSIPISKQENLYRQKYCGCVFSQEEAHEGAKLRINSKRIRSISGYQHISG